MVNVYDGVIIFPQNGNLEAHTNADGLYCSISVGREVSSRAYGIFTNFALVLSMIIGNGNNGEGLAISNFSVYVRLYVVLSVFAVVLFCRYTIYGYYPFGLRKGRTYFVPAVCGFKPCFIFLDYFCGFGVTN